MSRTRRHGKGHKYTRRSSGGKSSQHHHGAFTFVDKHASSPPMEMDVVSGPRRAMSNNTLRRCASAWCSGEWTKDMQRKYGHIRDWNTSQVTNMRSLFRNCDFNDDISLWNTSSVVDMSNMFRNATQFNQPIGTWNTSSVTDMHGMFRDARAFNQPLSSWDVSAVTDMSGMFEGADSFDQDVSDWNT